MTRTKRTRVPDSFNLPDIISEKAGISKKDAFDILPKEELIDTKVINGKHYDTVELFFKKTMRRKRKNG